MAKIIKKGRIENLSSYPLSTFFPGKKSQQSKTLTFDINFDFIDEEGERMKVWFYRAFRFPPPLEEGDFVTITGKFGQGFGLFSKSTFYASSIEDRKRGMIYKGLRNLKIKKNGSGKENKATEDQEGNKSYAES